MLQVNTNKLDEEMCLHWFRTFKASQVCTDSVFGVDRLKSNMRKYTPAETPAPREDVSTGRRVKLEDLRLSRHFDLVLLFGAGPSSLMVSRRARPIKNN